ncbi:MAG TPA: LPXTG cell wall anchor domain-containing protein, partial [Nocardioidaceae bacterium]|nr:LPXTG cell wall anchor domain-containing protein [Nocardioidaceae bacterium]
MSRADENDGGANGQCPGGAYCSTRDGSPSENGNGAGEAKGKPCAGCVGRAGNKKPQGQMPDSSDGNAGYECDRNHGIGEGNPAHTGCTEDQGGDEQPSEPGTPGQPMTPSEPETPSEPGQPVEPSTPGSPEGPVRPGNPGGFGQATPPEGPTVPGFVEDVRVPETTAPAAPVNRAAPSLHGASVLPQTGAPAMTGMLLAGAGLAGAGGILLTRVRRSRSTR